VVERTGLSRASVYRLAAAGVFPSPVKLGERASAWSEQEVAAWIEARLAERERPDAAA
jgi:prophage regulatory protein